MTCPISVVNTSSTLTLNSQIDLLQLNRLLANTEYNPRSFNALKYRIRNPRCTALVFSSGRVVICGPKSIRASDVAAHKIAIKICKVLNLNFLNFNVVTQNIVGSANYGSEISLVKLFAANPKTCIYEPEIFPGAILTVNNAHSNSKSMIFRTGKIIVTGVNSIEKLNIVYSQVLSSINKSFEI